MVNHFSTFSLAENFAIDAIALEKKYLEFQHEFHPDKSSSADISKSISVNEAYKILSDDFLRACHLLQLKNIDILNDEKAVKVDFATLEHVLELQEKIAEISDKNEIENLRKEINSEIKGIILQAANLLETGEINDSAQVLIKAKYLKKSLEDLKIRKQKI
jgi:molecular chaperone HscB